MLIFYAACNMCGQQWSYPDLSYRLVFTPIYDYIIWIYVYDVYFRWALKTRATNDNFESRSGIKSTRFDEIVVIIITYY